MLKILIDTDVILDALLNRAGVADDAADIWDVLRFSQVRGAITNRGLNRIIETLEMLAPDESEAINMAIQSRMEIYETTEYHLRQACNISNADLESAVEIVCVQRSDFGAILTNRPQDFICSSVETLSVDELLERQRLEETVRKGRVIVCSGNGESLIQLGQTLEKSFIEGMERLRISDRETFRGLSLRGIDLSGQDLHKMDFVEARLLHADLSHSILSGSEFLRANLFEADLSHSKLDRADFSYARLIHASLTSAELQYSRASYADGRYALLREASFNSANWDNSNLRNADIRSASLKHTFLNNVNLSHALLDGSCLIGASLVSSNLKSSSLRRTNLQSANLRDTDLRGADLTGACLRNSNLTDADLRGAILDRVDTCGATFTRVKADIPL